MKSKEYEPEKLLLATLIDAPDKAKIKWPKRKYKLVRGKVELRRTHFHPGTKEARIILEQSNRRFDICEQCGNEASCQVHHIDKNPFNNQLENLQVLCQTCHAEVHGIHDVPYDDFGVTRE